MFSHVNPSKWTPLIPSFLKSCSGEPPENTQRSNGRGKKYPLRWKKAKWSKKHNYMSYHFPCSCLSPLHPPCIWVYIPGSSCQSDLVQETSRGIWHFESSRHFQQSSPHSSLLTSWHQWRTSLLRPNCLVNLVIPCSCLSFPAAALELKTKTHIGVARPSEKKKPTPPVFSAACNSYHTLLDHHGAQATAHNNWSSCNRKNFSYWNA